MQSARSRQVGWIAGWLGGFVWVLILAIVALVQGRVPEAVTGGLLVIAAVAAVFGFAPWRHPATTFRRLMVPVYVVFFLAVAWGIWVVGDLGRLGIHSWWAAFLLLPLLLPLWTAGAHRWQDDESPR
jgi:uncharacterized membrane protein YfcA